MTDRLQSICEQVEREYQMGGLSVGVYADFAKEVAKRALSEASVGQAERVWEEFNPGECWWAGAILWLWEASWDAPRLAVADEDEGGEWHYEKGGKVGASGEPYPTHCSVPVAPLSPLV